MNELFSVLFYIFVIVSVIPLLGFTYFAHKVFSLLEKKYPKYYEKIGRPYLLITNAEPFRFTRERNAMNYQLYIMWGIPADSPKNKKLRDYAQKMRLSFISYMGIFFVSAALLILK